MKFRVELALRPASKPFISCSESALADGRSVAGRVFQQGVKPAGKATGPSIEISSPQHEFLIQNNVDLPKAITADFQVVGSCLFRAG